MFSEIFNGPHMITVAYLGHGEKTIQLIHPGEILIRPGGIANLPGRNTNPPGRNSQSARGGIANLPGRNSNPPWRIAI